MSVATKDGAWITATNVVRLACDKCGVVSISRWPMNDRETEDAIREHARSKHGGVAR